MYPNHNPTAPPSSNEEDQCRSVERPPGHEVRTDPHVNLPFHLKIKEHVYIRWSIYSLPSTQTSILHSPFLRHTYHPYTHSHIPLTWGRNTPQGWGLFMPYAPILIGTPTTSEPPIHKTSSHKQREVKKYGAAGIKF